MDKALSAAIELSNDNSLETVEGFLYLLSAASSDERAELEITQCHDMISIMWETLHSYTQSFRDNIKIIYDELKAETGKR